MIIAIPSETPEGLSAPRSGHFGHTPFFTLATLEGDRVTKLEVHQNVDHDEVGCGGVIDYAMSLGIDAIITVGMGLPPLTRFTKGGVKVYSDRVSQTVADALIRFVEEEPVLMDPADACRH